MGALGHLLLIDPDEPGREMLASRLRMQGYTVAVAADPAEGAVTALSNPPAAVVVARLLNSQLRKVDLIARWGGEEFIVALTGTGREGAATVGERVRGRLEAMAITGADGAPLQVTASFGAAVWRTDQTVEAVIDRADRAMYAAKHAGRNRVCVDPEVTGIQRLPAAS